MEDAEDCRRSCLWFRVAIRLLSLQCTLPFKQAADDGDIPGLVAP